MFVFYLFCIIFLRKQYGNTHIKHHTDDVVGDGDKRTGSDSRINFQLLQRHRNQGAEDGGKHHNGKKTQRYRIGYRSCCAETDEIIDIYQHGNNGGIDECHD